MKYILFAVLTFLPLFLSAQTPDSISIANYIDRMIDTCQGDIFLKKFDQALQRIERAKWKAEVAWGQRSAGYAKCLHNQVDIYVKTGRFKEALPYCIMAKEIREQVYGKDHLDYAQSLSYLATLYKELGEYDKAEPMALEVKAIRAINPGTSSREYAITLHLLGNIYYKLGQYEKSESYYQESIKILAKKPGKAAPEYSIATSNMAALYNDWGKYGLVEALYLEAKARQEKIPGKASAAYGGTLNNLAWFYFKTGQYNKAEPLFMEARQVFAKVYGTKHEHYVSTLTNLASFYFEMGQYNKAELLFLQAKEILESTTGKENRSYATTLTNLGAFYADIGQDSKAEAHYLEAKNISENMFGKSHPDYAMAIANLGSLYYKIGKFENAKVQLEEAKNIRQTVLGTEHSDYATSLLNLALLYTQSGKYVQAKIYFQEALDIWAKTLGLNHLVYAKALQNLAQLYAKTGDFGSADTLLLESKKILANTLGKEHQDYATILSCLALRYRSSNRFSEAVSLFLELNDIDRRLIEKSANHFTEKEMLMYLQRNEEDLEQVNSFAQVNPSQALTSVIFNNTLFYNGYLLENARDLSRLIARTDSLTRDTFERWQGCHRRLAKEYAKPIVERKYIAETEAEAEGYEKALKRKLPEFDALRRVPRWQDIRDGLQTDEAAVSFIHYRYYTPEPTDSTMYAALVLRFGDTIPKLIPLFEERQLLKLLDQPGLTEASIVKNLYGNKPEFRDLFWTPLEPLLRDVNTIYYAPTGLLHQINPAALLDASKYKHSESRQWVRMGSVRNLATNTLANSSFAGAKSLSDQKSSAIIFGGIMYEMDSMAYYFANSNKPLGTEAGFQSKDGNFRYLIEEQPLIKFRASIKDSDNTWEALANTGTEAEKVRTALSEAGFEAKVYKGFFASEEQFKRIGLEAPSPRVLHVATHGFAFQNQKKAPNRNTIDIEQTYSLLDDPMLRSGLVLAGANYYCKNKRPLTNAEDGMLVAYEVRDLNLRNTELAVLSACQTGLGDVVGSEGVYGLQRAFRIAGAKFLIVSLWQVPDEQTQELMRLFYQNWLDKKESLRDAFNHAQQELREKEPSPYMWAGFVLIE